MHLINQMGRDDGPGVFMVFAVGFEGELGLRTIGTVRSGRCGEIERPSL